MNTPAQPDPRAVFLLRASALQIMVAAGELELGDAIDRLIPDFEKLRPCACHREIVERLERHRPAKSYQRRAAA